MRTEPHPLRLDLRDPAEVLAYLPYRFGYVPSDSLAVLAVIEPEPGVLTLGLSARLDLADLADPDVLELAAAGVEAQLAQDRTVWVFTVLYTDEPLQRVRDGAGRAGAVLAGWLAACRYTEATASMVVGTETFRCVECAAHGCCPETGRPVAALRASVVAATMVLAGEMLVPSRADLGCPRYAPPDAFARAAAAAAHEATAMRRRRRRPEQRRRWLHRTLDSVGVALATARAAEPGPAGSDLTFDPELLGRLAAAMDDPDLRDAVVAWALGGERVRAGTARVVTVFEGVLTGALAPPTADHLHAATVLLTEVARHAAPGRAGQPLAVLAWLAWWRGEGARADVVLGQCLAEDLGCRLGLLLLDVLDHGVRPGWARPEVYVAPGSR